MANFVYGLFLLNGVKADGEGLAELIEGEDGAYVEPFSCLAPTSVTASSVETMLMRMLASVPTQSQLGGFANREKLSRLLFDRWWEFKGG